MFRVELSFEFFFFFFKGLMWRGATSDEDGHGRDAGAPARFTPVYLVYYKFVCRNFFITHV
jgi:hypothetical protein